MDRAGNPYTGFGKGTDLLVDEGEEALLRGRGPYLQEFSARLLRAGQRTRPSQGFDDPGKFPRKITARLRRNDMVLPAKFPHPADLLLESLSLAPFPDSPGKGLDAADQYVRLNIFGSCTVQDAVRQMIVGRQRPADLLHQFFAVGDDQHPGIRIMPADIGDQRHEEPRLTRACWHLKHHMPRTVPRPQDILLGLQLVGTQRAVDVLPVGMARPILFRPVRHALGRADGAGIGVVYLPEQGFQIGTIPFGSPVAVFPDGEEQVGMTLHIGTQHLAGTFAAHTAREDPVRVVVITRILHVQLLLARLRAEITDPAGHETRLVELTHQIVHRLHPALAGQRQLDPISI